MVKTVLGMEVGGEQIKLAQSLQRGKRSRVQRSVLFSPPEPQSVETTVQAVLDCIEVETLKSSAYVLCLPGAGALIQRLNFPFSKREKLREVLPYVLEDSLPVTLSEYVWDFFFASPPSKHNSGVYVVLYPREEVQNWTSLFKLGGVAVDRVELDITALDKVAGRIQQKDRDNALLVEIGRERSNLVWRAGETLLALRSLPAGLTQVDRELPGSRQTATGPGGIETVSSARETEASEALVKEVEGFTRQIRITLLATGGGHQPDSLILAGKARDLEFYQQELEQQTGLAVNPLHSVLEGQLDSKDMIPEASAAAAAALSWSNRREKFNLGRDPEEENTISRWKPHLRFAILALCFIFVSWSFMFGMDLYLQKGRCTKLDHQVAKTFQEIVPDAGKDIRPVQYASVIRSRIKAAGSANPLQELTRVKLTRILESMSKTLSPDLEFQTGLLALDHSTLRVSGLARDFKTVDAINSQLALSEMFKEVKIVGANLDQGGEKVSFSLELQLSVGSQSK